MYEMCASSYSCSLSSCDVSPVNRLRASVSAVLWKHLDLWEQFVVDSVVLCFVSHLLPLPHFYSMSIMSMMFKAKRKINILSQSAVLKLKPPPCPFFKSESFYVLKPFLWLWKEQEVRHKKGSP